MEYLVRTARITDIDRLVALSDGVVPASGRVGALDSADLLRQLVYLPQASIFVAEARRDVVGGAVLALRPSVVAGGFAGTVDLLVVDPDHDIDRVTDALIEEVIRSAQNKGCSVIEAPQPTDQINLTDEASRIMPVADGGFEQCYNAQAAVAAGNLLVVAADVVQTPNDKQQLAPMLGKLAALPAALGKADTLLADNGYFSEANVQACVAVAIEPLIALGREAHHPSLAERFATAPPAPKDPTPVQAMTHRLQTPRGRALYALRKQTPEPVFGIIKSVLGFRQFLLRGLDAVRGEWRLVTLAWNLKRMFALRLAL